MCVFGGRGGRECVCGSVFFACSRNVPHNYHIFKLPRAADSVGIFPLPLSAIKANCMRSSRGALGKEEGGGPG